MRNVKRGEGLSHLQNPGENDSSGGGSHPKPSRTSCPIDGILTWTRGTLWHFAPRAARESYKIIRRFVLDGAKDRVKPEWSEHRHRRKAPLVEAGGRRGRVARPDAMRIPGPFKNDCKRQQTQKKQKSKPVPAPAPVPARDDKQRRAGGERLGLFLWPRLARASVGRPLASWPECSPGLLVCLYWVVPQG